MDYFTIPILNGALPRWDGGSIEGLFLEPFFIKTIENARVGKEIFLCPFRLTVILSSNWSYRQNRRF